MEEAPPNSQEDTAVNTLREHPHVPVGPIGRGAGRIRVVLAAFSS